MLLSGEQLELTSGNQAVVVATVGATLRSFTLRGHPVLDAFAADEVCPGGRGQVLMPWPNRVADGKYELAGAIHQLPIDEPELGHAIHGLVRWAEWRVEHQATDAVRLRHRLMPRPGYPFALDLSVEYRLSSAGLAVTFGAMNVGPTSCPFGAGAHPYFTFSRSIDRMNLRVNADSCLLLDARSIPAVAGPSRAATSTSAASAPSAPRAWTPRSPSSTAIATASRASSCEMGSRRSRSGSIARSRSCRSTRATRSPTSCVAARASPWSP